MSKPTDLLTNVHDVLSSEFDSDCYLTKGNYHYYHYICDGFDDRGWGCGYRTLQTLCSWLSLNSQNEKNVPTIKEIQEILVEMDDKPETSLNSRQWIGSFEVCLVIDKLYDVPCKILHVNKGDKLETIRETLKHHFEDFGSPIMMGGDIDCSSKGVMGIKLSGKNTNLLIVDPHYVGKEQSKQLLKNKGWVKWQPLNEFLSSSFYNLCLPQVKFKVR
ncbi:probable Ufm1-specific protease 1 [Battus philenor]|uniref:probable Ufm1-specific protease 1 n=1 Tax=Battus philenor TaxID=42288 RepID=UPI0035CE8895